MKFSNHMLALTALLISGSSFAAKLEHVRDLPDTVAGVSIGAAKEKYSTNKKAPGVQEARKALLDEQSKENAEKFVEAVNNAK